MEIRKTDEIAEIYSKTTTTHYIEIAGKVIKIYHFQSADSLFNDYENEYEIDKEDKKLLTEDEAEIVGEYITEICELTQDQAEDFNL